MGAAWRWLVDFFTPYELPEYRAKRFLCSKRIHQFGMHYDSSIIGKCFACGHNATRKEEREWEFGKGSYHRDYMEQFRNEMIQAGYWRE